MIWSATDIIAAVNGCTAGGADWSVNGISIDSRNVNAGDLFIAIKGARHDGHDHISQATESGAVAVLVSRPIEADIPSIMVYDTLAALNQLALASRQRHHGTRIAITGSVGKTGTRMLVAKALAAYGKTHFSEGNLNNHIGAPLSLARMPQDAAFAVFECGMNRAGELSPLSRYIAPDIAVITKISDSHMAHFTSLNDIAMAKAEIFDGLTAGNSAGIALINSSDHFTPSLADKAYQAGAKQVLSFGLSDLAEFQIISVQRHSEGLNITVDIRGQMTTFSLGMIASHWAQAGVIALGIVDALGLPLEPAITALASARDLPGRGERSKLIWRQHDSSISLTLIDDSYNASPLSMISALESLAESVAEYGDENAAPDATPDANPDANRGRRVAILGDMLELGESAVERHQALAPIIEASGISILITVGALMEHLNAAITSPTITAIHAQNADAAMALLPSLLEHNDVILVKGSNGIRLSKLIDALKSSSSKTNGDSHAA